MKALSLIGLLFYSGFSIANSHEVSVGFGEFLEIEDGFLGVQYRHYLTELKNDGTPYGLQGYLQKSNNFSVGGFKNDDWHLYQADAEFFIGRDWRVAVDVTQFRDDSALFTATRDTIALVQVGRFVSENMQLGVTFIGERSEFDNYGVDERDTETAIAPFFRYTEIDNGVGWDVKMQKVAADIDFWQIHAGYYLAKNWQISASARLREDDFDQSVVELQTDYWFSSQSALKFGIGSAFDDGGINTITLIYTRRF
ncbi:hypothetical protein CTT31_01515 [Pseudoalteromonas maricaloris]|uniref:hypothetical protein n=1 Tax=Pseudoalteromonas TaxID=53246 RepID=UPI0021ADAE59|nr:MULTISPECIES: hypothetical protein [Pseudoalteromonas]MDP4490564.1 hypothetical protein [Pseudoalteromonas piscicida]USE67871.1 hypothetical protein CTT31_01515 [Pseudoalteromonas flavipulchra]